MTKHISNENIREMAIILLNAKDRDIVNLEKKILKLETALKEVNGLNTRSDCESSKDLEAMIIELKQENRILHKELKAERNKKPLSLADFY